ncbi:MAG: hypothetical protein M3R70_06795 [Actinomycetota bacterium]|nr:hypothetical protein [Actinomycetota bacterium]
MSAAAHTPAARGAALLLAHCAVAPGDQARTPVIERLRAAIGPDLTRLLLIALAGDHSMRSRERAAA